MSPERISRHSRSRVKGSAPIDIPARRKSSPGYSADMVFDMSPDSLTPSPTSSIYPATSRSQTKAREPFMYQVPIFRHSPDGAPGRRLRHKISRQYDILLTDDINAPTDLEAKNGRSGPSRLSEAALPIDPQQEYIRRTKTRPTTKITGFAPMNEHQPPINEKSARPTIPLHPPPRRLSPSRFPVRKVEHDVSYSQADPSLFEFQQHILRRMEHQDPSRFKSSYAHCL